jgi:serine/threonine protein phosphatase PrpC
VKELRDNVPAKKAIKQAFLKTDEDVLENIKDTSGSTAVTVLIRKEGDKRMLYCGNIGDARAVLW